MGFSQDNYKAMKAAEKEKEKDKEKESASAPTDGVSDEVHSFV